VKAPGFWTGWVRRGSAKLDFDDESLVFSLCLPGQRCGGAALAGLAGHVACHPNFDQIDIHAVLINWLCSALPGQRRSGAAWVGLARHDSGHDSGACCGAPRPARQVCTRAVLLGQPFHVAVHQRLHFKARLCGPVLTASACQTDGRTCLAHLPGLKSCLPAAFCSWANSRCLKLPHVHNFLTWP